MQRSQYCHVETSLETLPVDAMAEQMHSIGDTQSSRLRFNLAAERPVPHQHEMNFLQALENGPSGVDEIEVALYRPHVRDHPNKLHVFVNSKLAAKLVPGFLETRSLLRQVQTVPDDNNLLGRYIARRNNVLADCFGVHQNPMSQPVNNASAPVVNLAVRKPQVALASNDLDASFLRRHHGQPRGVEVMCMKDVGLFTYQKLM